MELIKQLAEIQQKLNAPKDQMNTFGNYKYRSCEDILTAVKPFLGDSILLLDDEIVNLGDRFYIKATATLKNKGEAIFSTGFAREAQTKKGMDEAQITGAASSYARKYALNGLLCIDDTKDADTNEQQEQSDNAPNWYNSFDQQRQQMLEKIKSGEQTQQGIIDSLKKAGYAISKKTQDQIKGLK